MCTLTVINLRTDEGKLGYRLMMNRDELRTRSRALPPEWREVDGVRAVWPLDMDGGGTWIAAAETGLTLALVNSFPEPMPELPTELISRGLIIPRLITSEGIEGVVDGFESIVVERYAPFRLVAVDLAEGEEGIEPRIAVVDWNRQELAVETHLDGPICLVSSGLGDSVVEPRLGVYEEMLAQARCRGRLADDLGRAQASCVVLSGGGRRGRRGAACGVAPARQRGHDGEPCGVQ